MYKECEYYSEKHWEDPIYDIGMVEYKCLRTSVNLNKYPKSPCEDCVINPNNKAQRKLI